MKLYRLNRYPDESAGEGENWDEWYSSLEEAKRARAQHIRDKSYTDRYGEDLSIDRVVFKKLPPPRQLLIQALRGGHTLIESEEQVVEPFLVPRG